MSMFDDISWDKKKDEINPLYIPWQMPSVISSNCPRHIGTRLEKLGDNKFQCPKGKEIYKSEASVANQTNRDRYDLGISW